jgi:F-type H+-transporting ATPase subunit b
MQEILNILGSLGFNWHVALANFINFLIILFILNKFFFGKIGKVINTRKSVIERGLLDSEEARKVLMNADEKKKEIIGEARKEGKGIIEKAQIDAESLATSIRHGAEKDREEKMESLVRKEENLKESVEKAFGEHTPELMAMLYKKTLLREMTEVENNALIARMK